MGFNWELIGILLDLVRSFWEFMGFYGSLLDFMGFNWDFMAFNWEFMGVNCELSLCDLIVIVDDIFGIWQGPMEIHGI